MPPNVSIAVLFYFLQPLEEHTLQAVLPGGGPDIQLFLPSVPKLQIGNMGEVRLDFFQSALAFGRFQSMLAGFPADTLFETIPEFHNTIDRYRQFKEVVEKDPCGRLAGVKAGVDLIISGAGLPMTLPELTRCFQTKIAPIVSSLKSVQVIWKYWEKKYNVAPDMVVIEGPKAGGHLGFTYEQLQDITALNFEEEIKKIVAFVKENAARIGKEISVVVAGGIDNREVTVNRDRKAAIQDLAILFFGIDGLKIN